MLDNKVFYFASIRKLVIAFGSLFDNIYIQKKADNDYNIQYIKVPFSYGPRQVFTAIKNAELNSGRFSNIESIIPRISFEFNTIAYDSTRKLNTMHGHMIPIDDRGRTHFQLTPVPYDISFNLNVYTELLDDSLQIIEQIIPYFTPSFNITINEIPEMNIVRDVPVQLNGVSFSDSYEGDFSDRRTIIWTLDFLCKGHLYPPIRDEKIIKTIIHRMGAHKENFDAKITISTDPLE